MLEENAIAPPGGNALHEAHYSNVASKIYYVNNKQNRNKNTAVIAIEEKLFKHKRPMV